MKIMKSIFVMEITIHQTWIESFLNKDQETFMMNMMFSSLSECENWIKKMMEKKSIDGISVIDMIQLNTEEV